MIHRNSIVVFGLCLVALVTTVSGQTETTITYQGELKDGVSFANGSFAMDFSLWDAAGGGAQIGSTQSLGAVAVADGRFTVELDFGASSFSGGQQWLQIDVNATPLVPRQPITRAPYSIQTRGILVDANENIGIGTTTTAARMTVEGDLAGIDVTANGNGSIGVRGESSAASGFGVFGIHDQSQNRGWLGSPDYGVYGLATDTANDWAGYFAGRAYVDDKLLVGRTVSVGGLEFFGVHAPVGNNVYGGMYISTDGEGGWPFYGYAAGGTGDMWHYYDGSTGKWHLHNGGIRMTVISQGWVGIGTQSPTAQLDVSSSGFAINGSTTHSSLPAVSGRASTITGTAPAVYGVCDSPSGYDFYADGAGINYGSPSSIRWKRNIEAVNDPLDMLAQIRGVFFDWDAEHGGNRDIGFIGEDIGKVLPEVVAYEADGEFVTGMDYSKMTPLLVEAVNALRKQFEYRLAAKDAEIRDLHQRIAAIESRFGTAAETKKD